MLSRVGPICAGVLSLLASACSNAPQLQVSDALVRELVPGRDVTAAYFTLINNTGQPVILQGAESSRARAIEMHTTVEHEGTVRMQRLTQIVVPAGTQTSFAPGGKHLMVFGVTQLTEPFPITLQFANGERIEVSFSKLAL